MSRRVSWLLAVVAFIAVLGGGFVLGRVTSHDAAGSSGKATVGGVAQPSEVDVLISQALDLHSKGRVGEAATLYRQALELDPTNKYAHYNLGVIAHGAGDTAQAISEYSAAIEADPAFGSALYNLGLVYGDQGDTDRAIEYLRRAVEADPGSARAHYNLGVQLTKAGSTAEGEAELEQAYRLDPALKP